MKAGRAEHAAGENRIFWWKDGDGYAIVPPGSCDLFFDSRIEDEINRPGPMQAEPVNLVRRGTEQP